MEITMEDADKFYVWRYFDNKDGKGNAWHLVKPVYMHNGKKWMDIEKVVFDE